MYLKRLKNTFKIDIKNLPGRSGQTGLPGNGSPTQRAEPYKIPNPVAALVRLFQTRPNPTQPDPLRGVEEGKIYSKNATFRRQFS